MDEDIELTPTQTERNRSGPEGPWNPRDVSRRSYSWARKCRSRRLAAQRRGRSRALLGDPLHLAGCMLYWAEGSKGKNQVEFANSELAIVVLFKQFLEECFDVAPDRFALTLNVYLGNGLSLDEVKRYWLEGLGLRRSCCRKHITNHTPTSSSGRRKNKPAPRCPRPSRSQEHRDRSAHLRRDPGVRGIRGTEMGRLSWFRGRPTLLNRGLRSRV